MNACGCGCRYKVKEVCPACAEEARALALQRSAGRLREVKAAFLVDARTTHYCPDLEVAVACLLNEARNHRHVAKILRDSRPQFPTAVPGAAHGAHP